MLGIIRTSKKEHERRAPIHPDHFLRIRPETLDQLVFERGYGEPFGISDDVLAEQSGGVATREELLADLGAVIMPKPMVGDLEMLREGGTLWGWPHCVQGREMTQVAIDRKLTLIAFEEMFVWSPDGQIGRHTFYKNNELAGYCAVLQALQLRGIDGHYGAQRKTVILSFGAVSRGAIYALKARGFRDITICIQRPDHEVREEVLDCHYVRILNDGREDGTLQLVEHDGSERPLIELLREADIILNGTFQNPNEPLMFVSEDEVGGLKRGALIIDVSCDEGMGFAFARPTSFTEPMFKVGDVDYYGVDHTPSYLWETASRAISGALIVHLPSVLAGRQGWQDNETIRRAVVIDRGVIQQGSILAFQGREPAYPYENLPPQ